jgi:hypothetical protein
MYEGKFVRWGIWAKGHDLAGKVNIELLEKNYSPDDLVKMIGELITIRERIRGREE